MKETEIDFVLAMSKAGISRKQIRDALCGIEGMKANDKPYISRDAPIKNQHRAFGSWVRDIRKCTPQRETLIKMTKLENLLRDQKQMGVEEVEEELGKGGIRLMHQAAAHLPHIKTIMESNKLYVVWRD